MEVTAIDAKSTLIPALSYRDAPAAISWLAKAFGFQKRLVVPNPDGTIAHAEMSFGTAVIMLATAKPERGWKSPLDLGGVNQSLCLHVADPDAHNRQAKDAGAEVLIDVHDTDYGSRGYTAKDLEGHVWTFDTYRPGAYWDVAES